MPERKTDVGAFELQSLLGRGDRSSSGPTATATVGWPASTFNVTQQIPLLPLCKLACGNNVWSLTGLSHWHALLLLLHSCRKGLEVGQHVVVLHDMSRLSAGVWHMTPCGLQGSSWSRVSVSCFTAEVCTGKLSICPSAYTTLTVQWMQHAWMFRSASQ